VQIVCENTYASVLVVPLDDLPLKQSHKVLVQIGTTARPSGWKTEPATFLPKGSKKEIAGERILDVGRNPWRIADSQLTVRLVNAAINKAVALDGSGGPCREVRVQRDEGAVVVRALAETIYLVLTRD